MVYEIKDMRAFQSKIQSAGSVAVIVDFWASWCGPCKQIAPLFEHFCNTYNVIGCKVNVDKAEDVADEFNVSCLPTFIVFRNGKKVDKLKGADEAELKALFKRYHKK